MRNTFARYGLAVLLLCWPKIFSFAQSTKPDSIKTEQLEEVVVTATRNERTMGALPMPVTLISKAQIKTMGSLRLNDVLTEQTGLVVVPQVNGLGNGIQMQGFNPDYTLILMDGEPIIGRYTGSLELSRLTVGNIKQIEIVKGPSSSLYGSDALAGVINIITERPSGKKGSFSSRYGTNKTLDLTGDLSLANDKVGFYAFANRYSTDGFDLSPENFGKTVSPFVNYTFGTKVTFKVINSLDVSLAGRLFNEVQDYNYDVSSNGKSTRSVGDGRVKDWNFNPVLTYRLSSRAKATARLYTTRYATNSIYTLLKTSGADSTSTIDSFTQTFTRPEVNFEYFFNEKHFSTIGAGQTLESVSTPRYGDEKKNQQTLYGFVQHEWLPIKELTLIGGVRFDKNTIYGSQLSPKFSARFRLNDIISLKGSFGVGFKSPDFRQLYLNFFNQAGGGYSVLGSEVVKEKLSQFEALGQIRSYLFDPALIGKLNAETSTAINLGLHADFSKKLKMDFNLFRNDVNNLIEYQIVALTTSNQNIYSYRNIKQAVMQGLEANFVFAYNHKFSSSVGYQLLFAKDKNVDELIDKGEIFWRDPVTLVTQRLKSSEYFGLYNRSRHLGNFKIMYHNKEQGIEGSIRVIYRGKFGLGGIDGNIQGETVPPSDRNGNGIQDSYDSFVKGYALVNVSLAKQLRQLRVQGGIDNLFNYTDPVNISNLQGRILYLSLNVKFVKSTNN